MTFSDCVARSLAMWFNNIRDRIPIQIIGLLPQDVRDQAESARERASDDSSDTTVTREWPGNSTETTKARVTPKLFE
jgi:hypothetical protein